MASIKNLELPCGVESEGGVIRKNVEIRKLKGKIQREIARLQAAKRPDAGAILDAILMPSVVGIEGKAPSINDIRLMLIADRDWLLFELRKHTWGPLISVKHTCEEPGCGEVTAYPEFDLNDLETVMLDDACWWDGQEVITAEQFAGMSEGDCKSLRCRVILLENDDLGVRAVFRYGHGRDQSQITKLANRPVEAMWKMMSLTCLSWDDPDHTLGADLPKKGLGQAFWDDVDMDIIDWVQAAFGDAQPGIETKAELECYSCNNIERVAINPTDFFFPAAARRILQG